jgi:hypothetical protein
MAKTRAQQTWDYVNKSAAAKKPSKPAKAITVVPPPKSAAKKDNFLRADPERSIRNIEPAVKVLGRETAGAYDLTSIADDGPGYGSRLRVLKALRGGDRVVVKDAEPAKLKRELYTAMGAKNTGDFVLKCAAMEAASAKAGKALSKQIAESKKRDAALKTAAIRSGKPVFDGKPILDAPRKLNKKEEAADQKQFKAELAARVAKTARETAAMPMAQPRADAIIEHDLSMVCLLEDPTNGITLLRLENPNSQGAICVYNNGSRVAAGVVATETLRILRVRACEDMAADVRLLLHPLSSGVTVVPVAERHLTALLQRIEENIMAGKKKVAIEEAKKPAKFAAPKGAPVKAAKAVKKSKDGAAPTERKSSLFRLLNDTKKTWEAFATQKGEIIKAFVKLGAVGKAAAGVTRAQLVAALPGVPDKNVSFYLSKWQPISVVEKLPAAE